MIALRNYQREAIDSLYAYFQENSGNPCISIPTGGGKSLIIAQFLREIFEQWPDQRVLVLTHVKELISQNYAELISLWPEAPAGVNSAGLNRRDFGSSIVFGGVQSLHRHAYDLQRIDLVIIDEAHLVPRTANTMYRRFLGDLQKINPYLKIIGLTATPFRLDSGMVHQGDDALFSEISYEANVRTLIEQKFLVPPRTISGSAQIDTLDVGTRGGEFIPGQLQAAASDPETVELICNEIVGHGANRRGWLVFGCGVDHCVMLRDELRRRGISCESIFGETPAWERDAIVRAYKDQQIRCLSSMGVLTTGFNAPHVDMIALARPTKSTGLYIQIVGRGLRTFPNKDDCLVLDFGGNIARHGPIDAPNVKEPGKGDGSAPFKLCPVCWLSWPTAIRTCSCGYEFPEPETLIQLRPAQERILQARGPEWIDVDRVSYVLHEKIDKPPSMCVGYHCGLLLYREWICLQHDGYARSKAVAWWQRRAPEVPVPDTIEQALNNSFALKQPTQICVRPSGRFFEIVGSRLP